MNSLFPKRHRGHVGPRCDRCHKNPKVCLCGKVAQLPAPAQLVIYQHPTEVWRPSNTAFLVTELYPMTLLVIRGEPDGEAELEKRLKDPLTQPFLIFPEEGALEVGEAAVKNAFGGKRPLFVMLDGSWRQARRMRRRCELLSGVPVLRLQPQAPSVYRVRKQSQDHHLSTAEAAALLLGRFCGHDGPDRALQTLFEGWIEKVLVFRGLPADYRKASGPLADLDDE